MDECAYRNVCNSIKREALSLLKQRPPEPLGRELWRIMKLINRDCGFATLCRIYDGAMDLKPLDLPEELKQGVLRIMVAARYKVDIRSREPEGDRSR